MLTALPSMEASRTCYRRSDYENMKKTKQYTTRGAREKKRESKPSKPLTKQAALEMLESAIFHCQEAGLGIDAENKPGATLALYIPGARFTLLQGNTRAAFMLAEASAPTPGAAN